MEVAIKKDAEVGAKTEDASPAATLPEARVEPISEDAFKIELVKLSEEPLWDQAVATASGQGCISSPGGPSC